MAYSEKERVRQCKRILAAVAKGEPVKKACSVKGSPSVATFNVWCAEDGQLLQRYRLAREEYAQTMADELVELADNGLGENATSTDVHHLKLRIDTRRWAVSKLLPQYSDKMQVQHSGHIDMSGTTDDELNAQLAQVITALNEIVAHDDNAAADQSPAGTGTG